LRIKNPGIGQRHWPTPIEEIQFNPRKIQKITENLIYWKTIFGTEIGQIRILERL